MNGGPASWNKLKQHGAQQVMTVRLVFLTDSVLEDASLAESTFMEFYKSIFFYFQKSLRVKRVINN